MKIISAKEFNFIWSGISIHGKRMTGEIQATNIEIAKKLLRQQDITPITLSKKRQNLFYYFNQKISAHDLALFFRQLATLITSGIPIVQSCEILRQSQEKMLLRNLINTIKNNVEAGKSLLNGLKQFPNYFDDLICQLVHAGEQTGTLETMLNRIAYTLEKSLALKNQIKQALFYPGMIFLVAIIVSFTLLTFVVPRFAELFQSMHGQLPVFTLLVVMLSQFLRNNLWLMALPLLASIFIGCFLKKSTAFRNFIDHIILKIPFMGNMIRKMILARFARSFATTFAAGVPITHALKIVAQTSGNYAYTCAILSLEQQISAGQPLHNTMQMNALFPPMTVQMVKIGEESGTLEHMLEKIADIYEADIDYWVANLSHLLEPLIMIILGVLIGGLVIAMYLPIFKLGTVI